MLVVLSDKWSVSFQIRNKYNVNLVKNHLLALLGNHYDSSILDESEFQILLYCAKLKYKDTCDYDLNDNNVIHKARLMLSRIMNKSPQDQIFEPLNFSSKQQINSDRGIKAHTPADLSSEKQHHEARQSDELKGLPSENQESRLHQGNRSIQDQKTTYIPTAASAEKMKQEAIQYVYNTLCPNMRNVGCMRTKNGEVLINVKPNELITWIEDYLRENVGFNCNLTTMFAHGLLNKRMLLLLSRYVRFPDTRIFKSILVQEFVNKICDSLKKVYYSTNDPDRVSDTSNSKEDARKFLLDLADVGNSNYYELDKVINIGRSHKQPYNIPQIKDTTKVTNKDAQIDYQPIQSRKRKSISDADNSDNLTNNIPDIIPFLNEQMQPIYPMNQDPEDCLVSKKHRRQEPLSTEKQDHNWVEKLLPSHLQSSEKGEMGLKSGSGFSAGRY